MRKDLLKKITKGFSLVILAMIAFSLQKAEAQYCELGSQMYGWLDVGQINRVTITDITEGNQIYERASGYEQWATVDRTGTINNPIELNIGNEYELTVNWGIYYQGYLRAYIDRNMDGRWDYDQMGPDKEFIGNAFKVDYDYYIPPIDFIDTRMRFTVDEDIQEGPSVLRLIVNYYEYNTDPCTIYYMPNYLGYGEAEDYAVKFVAPLPETYPTAGNILFNKEEYDGSQRIFNGQLTDFHLPSVESKGPQPAGTKLEYWITGPLPSNDVVYRALDPITGSPSIRFNTPTTKYVMQSATGPASVSTSEGTFLPTKGGEYKVFVKMTKPSGKSAEGVKVFTVANNYDMSLSGIISPRTSRAPRFFKYLRNTNIGVTCEVQNTGLNPIKKFEVTAKIYDADNDALISTQPKVVFDSDNDPNLMPLQSGQKYEANFAAFQTGQTGEYYVEFEVFYTYDEEKYNNKLPREDNGKHYFQVQYNDQLTAEKFENPVNGQILKTKRPNLPKVIFSNNGISDASNVNFHMVVKDMLGNEVYNEVSFLEELPQGRYNERLVKFPNLIIDEPGKYTACAWVDYPYDSKHDDDTVCVTFDVELGIQDTITVGQENKLIIPESNGVSKSSENQNGGTTQDAMKVEVAGANFNFNGFTSNPASSVTTINYDSKEPLTLQVVDMSGNIVFTKQVDGTSYNLDVTRFASGAYTVLLRNESGLQSRQLSVIK